MKSPATKEKKLLLLAAVLLVAAVLVSEAEATRYLPNIPASTQTLPPPTIPDVDQIDAEAFWLFAETDVRLFSVLALLDASELEQITAENRIRLFEDPGAIPRPVELAAIRKLASGVLTCAGELNVWEIGDLAQVCGSPSFQGLWTDPTTGIAYARNRWYDARNASWLSEDPMGAVDSVNLYAFVGWGPHMGTDPMGLEHIGWLYQIRGHVDGVYTEYVGSTDNVQIRFDRHNPEVTELLNDPKTEIRVKRIYGELDSTKSNRGTLESARKEALASQEQPEIDASQRRIERLNRRQGPSNARSLNKIRAARPKNQVKWEQTYSTSRAKRWRTASPRGQAYSRSRMPSASRAIKGGAVAIMIAATILEGAEFAHDSQPSPYVMEPAVFEDSSGSFFVGRCGMFGYCVEYIEGQLKGHTLEIDEEEYEAYKELARLLWGWIDPDTDEFVPGLLRQSLCEDCA